MPASVLPLLLLALLLLINSACHSPRKTEAVQPAFQPGDTVYIEKPNGEVEMKVIQKVGK